jgi:diaminopimelate epimerase
MAVEFPGSELMPELPFIKMHGCGNDYVYIDCFQNPSPDNPAALARQISDRHRSIGSDGLVLMLPSDVPAVAARMRMCNADGSEGALCGNALRCMALWLYQSGKCGREFQIIMINRLIQARILESDSTQRRGQVRVSIGTPERPTSDTPGFSSPCDSWSLPVSIPEVALPELVSPVMHVSMGNPHTILFVRDLESVDFYSLGPRLENHPSFPKRTNVEFVQITDHKTARVRVWERGSGETLACGSGACAVAVAGMESGHFSRQEPVRIGMDGGILTVLWDKNDTVHLEGAAQEAFRGVICHS